MLREGGRDAVVEKPVYVSHHIITYRSLLRRWQRLKQGGQHLVFSAIKQWRAGGLSSQSKTRMQTQIVLLAN